MFIFARQWNLAFATCLHTIATFYCEVFFYTLIVNECRRSLWRPCAPGKVESHRLYRSVWLVLIQNYYVHWIACSMALYLWGAWNNFIARSSTIQFNNKRRKVSIAYWTSYKFPQKNSLVLNKSNLFAYNAIVRYSKPIFTTQSWFLGTFWWFIGHYEFNYYVRKKYPTVK